MAEINLTQTEADALISLEKHRINEEEWEYPDLGGAISVPLISTDRRENFILDISRGRIDLLKGKYQSRARQMVVLLRLDFGSAPHRNPDGEEISSPHLHIYREGYGDKWATPVPMNEFLNVSDRWRTLQDFMRFCNITDPPSFIRGLFT